MVQWSNLTEGLKWARLAAALRRFVLPLRSPAKSGRLQLTLLLLLHRVTPRVRHIPVRAEEPVPLRLQPRLDSVSGRL